MREEVPIRSFSVSAYLCKKDSGKFLLLERTSQYLNRTWQEISGLIEPRESAWEAALREIKEETSLTPYRFYSADFVERFYEHGQNVINLVPVFVGYVHDDARVRLSDEHSDFIWVSLTEALEHLQFSQQKEAITHVQHTFVDNEPSEHLRINFEAVGL
jgi:dATP pyrophosphohydrolase